MLKRGTFGPKFEIIISYVVLALFSVGMVLFGRWCFPQSYHRVTMWVLIVFNTLAWFMMFALAVYAALFDREDGSARDVLEWLLVGALIQVPLVLLLLSL